MLANSSLDQKLIRARSHLKSDKIAEDQKLNQDDAETLFSQKKDEQQGLANFNKPKQNNPSQIPPQEVVDQLVNLYHQGQFLAVVEQAQAFTKQYPETFILWNILGASAVQIAMPDQAVIAFKKVISFKPDYADAYSNMGVALQQKGELDEAVKAYKKALSLKPDNANAYYNMGNVLKDQGKLDDAIKAYNKSISLKPDYAETYNNIGNVLKDQGKLDEAINAFNKALSIKPNHVDAFYNLGNAFKDQGKVEEAIDAFQKSISLKPDYVLAYNNMGNVLLNNGKFDQAIIAYNKALLLKPDYADGYYNLGNAFKEQGKLDKAFEVYKKAVSLNPNHAFAYNNMGIVLKDQDKLDEAITAYNKALSLKPDYANAYYNLGNALKEQCKIDEPVEAYKRAISLKPDYADAYSNFGIALKDQGKLNEAIDAYYKCILLKPNNIEAHINLGFALLNSGKLQKGLDENEWRWKSVEGLKMMRHFSKPLWDGKKSLNGKRILLWAEQGIADVLHWSSCLPYLSSQAEHCILECHKKLIPLLERSFPNVELKGINRNFDLERDDFDFHLPMGSLYRHFIQEISQNVKPVSILIPDPSRVKYWKKRLNALGKGPYIGVSWKSSIHSAYRSQHYPPIPEWTPIFTIPDVTFINLQYKDFSDDLTKIKDNIGVTVHNFNDLDHFDDIDEVAALSAALDMVVSVKNSVLFTSAGVGTTTILTNWRQSSFSNIYYTPITSSFKIFERDTWESWENVFNLIAEDIFKLKNKISKSKDKL